jgi:hypothetical protein
VELHSHTLGLDERARWKVVVEAPSWPSKQHMCSRLLYLFSLTLFQSFVKWNSHSKSIINNDSHLLQPLWIPQILCEMEFSFKVYDWQWFSPTSTTFEFNNISEFWNVHNKHVIWNLNMDNHMINSGKKQPINKAPWSSHQWN